MKEIHVNMSQAIAVETFLDDDGFITGQTVHFAGDDADGKARKFSTTNGQWCDPDLTEDMITLRGHLLDGDDK